MKMHPTHLQLEGLYLELEPWGRSVLDHVIECARCRERVMELLREQNSRPDEPDGSPGPRGPGVPDDPSGTLCSRVLPFALVLARDGFLAEGIPYDTALVSLEIATLYAEQRRTAELKRLSREMVPVFSSLHIHREALVALAFLVQAIEKETASLEVVTAVAEYLRRAEREPELPFRVATPSRE